MATSQNGWGANDRSVIHNPAIPGTAITLPGGLRRGDITTVLLHVAARFHREVEPLVKGWNWGYAERAIRGSTSTLSNHASGTAIDLNAPRHPLGKRGTFTAAQVAAIRHILATCQGVVRWGGDYTGRADEMHFEVVGNAAAVARVARALHAPAPSPAPRPVPEDDMTPEQDRKLDVIYQELTKRHASRSAYAVGNPKPTDTMAGAAFNADGRSHEGVTELRALRAELTARLNAIDAALAALSRKDTA